MDILNILNIVDINECIVDQCIPGHNDFDMNIPGDLEQLGQLQYYTILYYTRLCYARLY